MENCPESMLNEDLFGFSTAAKIILGEGICSDMQVVLHTYVSCLMRNRMRINIDELKKVFKLAWHSYFDKHKQTIVAYLEKYYRAEFCVGAIENLTFEYANLEEQYYDDLFAADLELLKGVEKFRLEYVKWLFYDEEDESEKIENKVETKKQDYKDIIEEFKEMFLSALSPKEVIDIKEYICETGKSMKLYDELSVLEDDYKLRHWGYFITEEYSLEFLISFYKYKGVFSVDFVQAAEDIFDYIEYISDIEKTELIKFFITIPMHEGETYNNIWAEKQLFDNDAFFSNESSYLTRLVKAGVFICSGRWYRLCNDIIMLFAYIKAVVLVPDEERAVLYQSFFDCDKKVIQEQVRDNGYLSELINKHILWSGDYELELMIIKTIWSFDEKHFKENIYYPAAYKFYNEVYDNAEYKVIYNLIKVIDLGFDLDASGEVGAMHCGVNAYFMIREAIYEEYITDMIPDTFSRQQVDIFKRKGLLKDSGNQFITLMDLYEQDLLSDMGIMDNLLNVWETMKEGVV